ncbi:MAG: hypothetical protein LQ343_007392 [Gyalolechia ehrenbergii]|nr:MAG: hypothetical protein LQ343_007392 [Gyalolechia ehrenbergii]
MPEAMDALKSFVHLTDSIPDWLVKLDELAVQVAEQHSRFSRLSQSQFTEFRLSKKHDSTESLRPPKDDLDDPSSPALLDPFAPSKKIPPTSQPGANILVKQIRRKRKSGSAELSAASGPQRYRTRSLVIVYYDSAIQEAFEQLVRSIAGARNNLRKGRTAASFKARMASMGMREDEDDQGYPALSPKVMIKRASRVSPPTESPSFRKADEDLDAAQNLCEVAAHQFLREGDCGEEIAGTRKRFEECLETAKAEVEKLQAEEANKSEVDPTEQAPEVVDNPVTISTEKTEGPRIPTIPTLATTGTIEVDNDSDASSVHLDLTAFRRMRRV